MCSLNSLSFVSFNFEMKTLTLIVYGTHRVLKKKCSLYVCIHAGLCTLHCTRMFVCLYACMYALVLDYNYGIGLYIRLFIHWNAFSHRRPLTTRWKSGTGMKYPTLAIDPRVRRHKTIWVWEWTQMQKSPSWFHWNTVYIFKHLRKSFKTLYNKRIYI